MKNDNDSDLVAVVIGITLAFGIAVGAIIVYTIDHW
jgi:hypothetical protein